MVNDKVRRPFLDSYDLQDVELHRVQGSREGFFQGESPGRMLTLAPMRLHNAHVRGGKKRAPKGCRICSKGLAGAMETSPEDTEMEKRRMAKSGGANEEGATAPAHGDGAVGRAYKLLFGGEEDLQESPGGEPR